MKEGEEMSPNSFLPPRVGARGLKKDSRRESLRPDVRTVESTERWVREPVAIIMQCE